MQAEPAEVLTNAAWDAGQVTAQLSIVVPFKDFDVAPLAGRLIEGANAAGVSVPIIFVDDGSRSPAFRQRLWAALSAATQPCQMVALRHNVGRAKVRNYLCQVARTTYLLYLDADMWPDRPDFLARYLAWIAEGGVDVIYGGRSANTVVLTGPEYELHRLMTVERETLPASTRRESPAYHFYSCNFVVRRDILDTYPLDEQFTGWGWEDCEWACRVAEKHQIRHEDNSASHLGLLTAPQILQKYDESIGNFSLMLGKRPALIAGTSLYKVARLIGLLHVQALMAPLARWMAESSLLPMSMRMRGLMFYKASLYAPIVGRRP
jgi:hypothetical protein